jgi:MFS family permease
MSQDHKPSNYRWYMLALSAATATLVIAIPFSCMPSLFKEISEDMRLSLVEVGTIWGIGNLAGFFISLPGGLIGDRFGVKPIIVASCILAGITGASRGLSGDFLTLAITVFLNGLTRAIVPVVMTKMIGMWFKSRNLGMANGIGAMGMGLGLMLGPMISATTLSPLLGGWRHVLMLYGAISVVMGIFWLVFGKETPRAAQSGSTPNVIPMRQALSRLVRVKSLWIMGLMLMFRSGGTSGMIGYLPLYLRDRGWAPESADNALAIFFAASALCVIPLSSLSDKFGSRRAVLFTALILSTVCLGMLSFADGIIVWVLMIMAGMFFDGFMAIFSAMLLETEGVGLNYYGTALGLVFTISQVGSVISPPLGNSFASTNPGLPFVFWAGISAVALIILVFNREKVSKRKPVLIASD